MTKLSQRILPARGILGRIRLVEVRVADEDERPGRIGRHVLGALPLGPAKFARRVSSVKAVSETLEVLAERAISKDASRAVASDPAGT